MRTEQKEKVLAIIELLDTQCEWNFLYFYFCEWEEEEKKERQNCPDDGQENMMVAKAKG